MLWCHWTLHKRFPINVDSNIWPNSALLRDISFQNLIELDINLSRSLGSKCNRINGLPMYAFLFIFNSNIWPNYAPIPDIRLINLSDLDFDLSMSLKVKCDGVIWLSIYCFLLIYIVTTCLYLTFQFLHTVQWWIWNFR